MRLVGKSDVLVENFRHSPIAGGRVVAGCVKDSVLGRNIHVHVGAVLEECVVLDKCEIGSGAHLRRTIPDKNVRLPGRPSGSASMPTATALARHREGGGGRARRSAGSWQQVGEPVRA
jgi:NDP-sugar pyrophosphorylase family protein